ncbi:MAG: ATPase [Bacteroidales bacterium]|nr:ATPase [Bacteroidales bacterium]
MNQNSCFNPMHTGQTPQSMSTTDTVADPSEYSAPARFAVLIADGGATKTEWVALDRNGCRIGHHISLGANAVVTPREEMCLLFKETALHLPHPDEGAEIYYYGAGCATPEISRSVESALKSAWPAASADVASDMLGAARGLLGRERGIACILGTGSNAALCDAGEILKGITSLGFILGDEGSGAALGKRFFADYFKGYLPENIKEDFDREYGYGIGDVLTRVYQQLSPNRFLASIAPFLCRHSDSPYIRAMLIKEFAEFFKHYIATFEGARHLPIAFTGSIADHFERPLRDAADSLGFKVSKIVGSPMAGLIDYHSAPLNHARKAASDNR